MSPTGDSSLHLTVASRVVTKLLGVAVGSMEGPETVLGDCPHCATTIPKGGLLVSYQCDGWPAMYAECPDCAEVVHPQ